jgi:hypothetical protein
LGTRVFLEWASADTPGGISFAQRARKLDVDPTTAVLALKEHLNDADPKIHRQAAQALSSINGSF